MRETALALNCPILDLRTPFLDSRDYPALMCRDGIHPNEDGQRLMADTILDRLRKRGMIPGLPRECADIHARAC